MSSTAKGLLWIFSGPTLLVAMAMLQVIIRLFFSAEDNVIASLINIVSWLAGTVAVLLFIVGPVVGIISLAKKQNNPGK